MIRKLTGDPKVRAAVRVTECWSSRLACTATLIAAGFFVVDILIEESLYSWRLFGAIAALAVAVGAVAIWAIAALLGLAVRSAAPETTENRNLRDP